MHRARGRTGGSPEKPAQRPPRIMAFLLTPRVRVGSMPLGTAVRSEGVSAARRLPTAADSSLVSVFFMRVMCGYEEPDALMPGSREKQR